MITTHEAHKAPMFSIGPGFSTWRTATLTLGMPYVFINYGLKDGRGWSYQTSILWDNNDVLDFCRNLSKNKLAKIVDISVLEPFRRDKKQSWRWSKVTEVRSFQNDSVNHPVYIDDSGRQIGLTAEVETRETKLVCKVPIIA